MKHDHEERKQRRINNALQRAAKNEELSESLYNSAREMGSQIPFGQPILVGHHSEGRHRRHLDRVHNTYGKSFEAQEKAQYYREKAATIESNNAISSDDPHALEKLKQKLADLTAAQEFMKAANNCIRKQDREKFLTLPGATSQLWEQLNEVDRVHGKGFPHYKRSNNSAEIRRLKMRMAKLEQQQSREQLDKTINGIRVFENREANRLQMIFPGKPDEATRKKLKSNGFRWSPTQGAWQRHISTWAARVAVEIAEACKE